MIDNLAFYRCGERPSQVLTASFDGRTITYGFDELDALVLAHAAIKSGARMPGVKAHNFGAKIAESMH